MYTLRIARPTDNLQAIATMYEKGLGMQVLSQFEDHDGFDGIMVGQPNAPYHLEFTTKKGHAAGRAPTQDNLLIYYIPNDQEWTRACQRMIQAGFVSVSSFNPFWDLYGKTYEDLDGYRIVLQNTPWGR